MAELTAQLSSSARLKQKYSAVTFRLRLLPWQISAGGGLLLLSLLAVVVMVIPQYQAINEIERSIIKLQKQMPQNSAKRAMPSSQASLNTFYDFLPPESAINRLVGKLLEAGVKQGIRSEKVEYQLIRMSGAHISRYQITLPVHAQYAAVRAFITEVLNILPNAALNDVTIVRDQQSEGMVNARMRFTLYFQYTS